MTRAREIASQGGLVLLNTTTFSAQSSVSINSIFSATYNSYSILLSTTGTASASVYFRLRTGATDNTSGSYYSSGYQVQENGSSGSVATAAANSYAILQRIHSSAALVGFSKIDIVNPFLSTTETAWGGTASYPDDGVAYNRTAMLGGRFISSTSFDGFTVYPSGGTLSGTVKVYGYK
jgi:hypothetical protein